MARLSIGSVWLCLAALLLMLLPAPGSAGAAENADTGQIINHPNLGHGHFARVKDALKPEKSAGDGGDVLPDVAGLGRLTILTRVKGMLQDQSFRDAQSLWTTFRQAYERRQAGLMTPAGLVENHIHQSLEAVNGFREGLRIRLLAEYGADTAGRAVPEAMLAEAMRPSAEKIEVMVERLHAIEESMRRDFRKEQEPVFSAIKDLMRQRDEIREKAAGEKLQVRKSAAREMAADRTKNHEAKSRIAREMREKTARIESRLEKRLEGIEQKLAAHQRGLGDAIRDLEVRIETRIHSPRVEGSRPAAESAPSPRPQA